MSKGKAIAKAAKAVVKVGKKIGEKIAKVAGDAKASKIEKISDKVIESKNKAKWPIMSLTAKGRSQEVLKEIKLHGERAKVTRATRNPEGPVSTLRGKEEYPGKYVSEQANKSYKKYKATPEEYIKDRVKEGEITKLRRKPENRG